MLLLLLFAALAGSVAEGAQDITCRYCGATLAHKHDLIQVSSEVGWRRIREAWCQQQMMGNNMLAASAARGRLLSSGLKIIDERTNEILHLSSIYS